MPKLFYIVFRTGGTDNFKWSRSLPMTREQAETSLDLEYRAGRTSSMMVPCHLSDAIGLPETFGEPNKLDIATHNQLVR